MTENNLHMTRRLAPNNSQVSLPHSPSDDERHVDSTFATLGCTALFLSRWAAIFLRFVP